jgi:GntR family transcriptional regulator
MPPDPRYRRIADDLRRKIESGEIPPGGQLPTEAELMEQYRVSRNTIRDALRLLITRRTIDAQPGRGTFVVEPFKPVVTPLATGLETGSGGDAEAYEREISALGRQAKASDPQVEILRASRRVAKRLRIEVGAQVVRRQQRRFIDDVPWSMMTSFYPMEFVQRGATDLIQATGMKDGIDYLKDALGIEQAGYQDHIWIRPPNDAEAAFFGLPETGASIIEIYRTAYDTSGHPFRVTINTYTADRNHFIINVGKVPEEVKGAQWFAEAF